VALETIALLPLEPCLKFALAYERLQILDCISSKRSYEGNAAFQIGKHSEAGAVAEE